MTVGHLFFEYHDNLKEVHLRWLPGSALMNFFQKWLNEYPDPYGTRYRKQIPYGFVKKNGILLITLKDGEVAFPVLSSVEQPVKIVSESGEPEG
jgi:hypothetical protein